MCIMADGNGENGENCTSYNELKAKVKRLRELLHQQLDRQYNPFEPDNQSYDYKRLKAELQRES